MDQPVAYPDPDPCNYRRIALAALGCITDMTIEQEPADGTTATAAGGQACTWLKAELGNAWFYEQDPRWAIVPRQPVAAIPLQARFSTVAASVGAGGNLQFFEASSGLPTAWSWDFGDGRTSTQRYLIIAKYYELSYI